MGIRLEAPIRGRRVAARRLCEYGNGACTAPASRKVLTDSQIENPNGSLIYACAGCADRMAFGLLASGASAVVTVPLGGEEAK
jgi:hypothetical protein